MQLQQFNPAATPESILSEKQMRQLVMLFLELSRPEVTLMFAGFVTPGEMHNGAFIVKNSQGSRINSDSPLILGV